MTIKIILADSHRIIRQGLANLLAGEPDLCVVGEAEDCATTLKLIQDFSPQVVVMDISLPDANGMDATRRIVSQFPRHQSDRLVHALRQSLCHKYAQCRRLGLLAERLRPGRTGQGHPYRAD